MQGMKQTLSPNEGVVQDYNDKEIVQNKDGLVPSFPVEVLQDLQQYSTYSIKNILVASIIFLFIFNMKQPKIQRVLKKITRRAKYFLTQYRSLNYNTFNFLVTEASALSQKALIQTATKTREPFYIINPSIFLELLTKRLPDVMNELAILERDLKDLKSFYGTEKYSFQTLTFTNRYLDQLEHFLVNLNKN